MRTVKPRKILRHPAATSPEKYEAAENRLRMRMTLADSKRSGKPIKNKAMWCESSGHPRTCVCRGV